MRNIKHTIYKSYLLLNSQIFDFVSIIPIEIEFGVLKAKECQNFGICRIVRLATWDNNSISISPCRQARAYLIWRSETTIQLSVLWSSMLPCTQAKYFGQGQFLIPQDFYLPEDLCSSTTTTTYFIPKGNYKAMKNSEFVHLLFQVQLDNKRFPKKASTFSPILKREREKWRYPNAADP